MNTIAFQSVRSSHPNPIVEFRWPVGKEVPSDIRRLTVPEFHLAVQLAAKCVRDARGTLRQSEESLDYSRMQLLEAKEEDFVYKEKYENLLYQFQSYLIETRQADPSQKYIAAVREEMQVQLHEVMAELDHLKSMMQMPQEVTPTPQPEPQPIPQAEVQQQQPKQRKRPGRKPKVQFAA